MAENAPQTEPFTGRPGHLSPAQCEGLRNFKSELMAEGLYVPAQHDDYLMCRFLRARKFDLPKSKKMCADYLAWRKEFGVDELVRSFDFPESDAVHAIYPRYYHKVDKEGRPIYIEHLGTLNLKELMRVTDVDRILKNHVVEYERLINVRLPACSAQKGVHLEQSVTILDLKNVSLVQFTQVYRFIQQISTIAQNYYPEMLGKMFIINAPFLFSSVWNMIKGLLDEVTVSKIHIVGTKYQALLLEHIDARNIPTSLGGTCECDGGCDRSDAGPWNRSNSAENLM